MGGVYSRVFRYCLTTALLLALFPVQNARAGAINAEVSRNSVVVKKDGADKLSLSFDVRVIYNGTFGDDLKEILPGKATATYQGDAQNLRWTENHAFKLSHEAKKSRLYKIEIQSFNPNSVTYDGDTTDNDNLLWTEWFVAVIDWNPENIMEAPEISPRPVKESKGTVALIFKRVGGGYVVSPDQGGPYRDLLGTWGGLQNTVQRALIAAFNRSDPYIKVSDPAQANNEGTLDTGSAIQLLQNYSYNQINVEDEVSQATDPKPPVIRLLNKNGNALRDALVFELSNVILAGGQLGSDNHFFWFKSRKNSNLWIVIDEDGDVVITLADAAGSDTGKWIYGKLGNYGTPENNEEISLDKSTFDSLVMYRVFNECGSASACAELNFSKIVDYPEYQSKFGTGNVPWNHQIAINANGKNKDAWLDKWAVNYEDRQADGDIGGDCGIFAIIAAGDIGEIFSKMIDCMFKRVFRPMIDWAADLVQKAAGVSYHIPERKHWGQYV